MSSPSIPTLVGVIQAAVYFERLRNSALALIQAPTYSEASEELIRETRRLRALFDDLSHSSFHDDNAAEAVLCYSRASADLVSSLEKSLAVPFRSKPRWLPAFLVRRRKSISTQTFYLTGQQSSGHLQDILIDALSSAKDQPGMHCDLISLDRYAKQSLLEPRKYLKQPYKHNLEISGQGTQTQIPMTRIPQLRNLHRQSQHGFFGRAVERQRLQCLIEDGMCSSIAIVGLGGIGKSALAEAVARDYMSRNKTESILWLPASSETELERSLNRILTPHLLGDVRSWRMEDCFHVFKRLLSTSKAGSWIVILDGINHNDVLYGPRNLHQFLPSNHVGTIIFTSRDPRCVEDHVARQNILRLGDLRPDDAYKLLRSVCPSSSKAEADAMRLLKLLCHLPQAILLAGAFMKEHGTDARTYLESWETMASGNGRMKHALSHHPDSVVEFSYLLSMQSWSDLQEQSVLAVKILDFAACVDSRSVPKDSLPKYGPDREIRCAIQTLCKSCLIEWQEQSQTLALHGLVRLAVRNRLRNQGTLLSDSRSAYEHITSLFPPDISSSERRDAARMLLPHIESIAQTFESDDMYHAQRMDHGLFKDSYQYCRALGMHSTSLYLAKAMHKIAVGLFGTESDHVISMRYNIATDLVECGVYDQARSELQSLLAVQTKRDTPPMQVLSTRHQLGRVLYLQGSLAEAGKLLSLVHLERKALLGEDDVETLRTLNNLALVLQSQGELAEAETQFRTLLTLRLRKLGEDHADTLTSMNNLGTVLHHRTDKMAEAFEYYVKAKVGRAEVLGMYHPETLKSHANMAALLQDQGNYQQAELLSRNILIDYSQVLRSEHPDVLSTKYNLATAVHAQLRYEDAEKIYREVATARKAVLGEEHPDTIDAQTQADELEKWLITTMEVD